VYRREVQPEARVLGEPSPHLLALVGAHIVADDMDRSDRGGRVLMDALEKLNHLRLSLASSQDAYHFAAAGVERRQQVQGTFAHVLVLHVDRPQARLRRTSGLAASAWLQRGLLVEAKHTLKRFQRARV
jgi:hypothetical protein